MAYATTQDLIQVEPTITEYGVLDFDVELARSEAEINRVLKVRWFHTWLKTQANTVDEFDTNAEAFEGVVEERDGTAIEIGGADDVLAGRGDGGDGIEYRGLP